MKTASSILAFCLVLEILGVARAADDFIIIEGGGSNIPLLETTDTKNIKFDTIHGGVRGAATPFQDDLPSSASSLDAESARILKKNTKKNKNNKGKKRARTSAPSPSPTPLPANSTLDDPKIIGGTNAAEGQYPYFASIIDTSKWLCGASLVAPDMLITAGHCTVAFKRGAIVGAYKLAVRTPGSVQVNIVQQILDPNFKTFEHNDVLLLKISPAVSSIAPVEINFNPSLPASNEPLEIIGFGQTANTGPASRTLKQAQVYQVSASKCEAEYGNVIVPTQHICVVNTNPFRGSCDGDSGGPLLGSGSTGGQTLTFGVTSFGANKCTKGYSVYTRLSGYSSFIQGTICKYSANPPAYLNCGSSGGGGGSQSPQRYKKNKKIKQHLCSYKSEPCSSNQECCSAKCKQGKCK